MSMRPILEINDDDAYGYSNMDEDVAKLRTTRKRTDHRTKKIASVILGSLSTLWADSGVHLRRSSMNSPYANFPITFDLSLTDNPSLQASARSLSQPMLEHRILPMRAGWIRSRG